MANIRQIEAPKGIGLTPTETGIESMAAVGRRLGAFGSQIAEDYNQEGRGIASAVSTAGQVATDYMTHRDISVGAAEGAKFIAQKNDEWNEIANSADPNDLTVKQKFLEENLNPALDKFKVGFSTDKSQQWAEHFVDQYRNHMSQKTSADMSTLAGIAVRKNVATTVNSLSSAVASDPSSLDFALSSVDHSIGATIDSNRNIDATTAASVKSEIGLKAKEAIVKAAVSGMIQKNPNVDLDAIQKKYGEYINGAEMKMFQKAAQTQAKVDFLQNKAIESYQDKQRERAAGADLSKTFNDNVTFDADGKVTIKPDFYRGVMDTVRKYPGSADDTARALIAFGQHQAAVKRETIVTDPTVQSDLLTRMTDPKNPTTETQILIESNKNKLDPHATSNLLALRKAFDDAPIKDPVFHSTFEAAKNVIAQSFDGQENFGKFAFNFLNAYREASRSGTLKPGDLDMSKEDSLISREMKQFKPSDADRMTFHLMRNFGADPSKVDLTNIKNFGGGSQRKIGDTPVPAVLNGIAALKFNKDLQQFRDETTGAIYDVKGNPVKR